MNLSLKKFGTTLTSRQSGREAFAAIQPVLGEMSASEPLVIDFDGVVTFSPSWADEVITPLQRRFQERLTLAPSTNPSVAATLELLKSIGA
jgi:hypothetical protein